MTTTGILWPGAMGSALGRAGQAGGARVVTTVAGRSERTRQLAEGLTLLGSVDEVVTASDAVVSIVPSARALAQAHEIAAAVARTGHTPVVADLNAISPMTMGEVAEILGAAGCRVVDGAISGAPPSPTTDTVLFPSGPDCSPATSPATSPSRSRSPTASPPRWRRSPRPRPPPARVTPCTERSPRSSAARMPMPLGGRPTRQPASTTSAKPSGSPSRTTETAR